MLGVDQFLASRGYAATSLKQRRVILGQFVRSVGDPATTDAERVLAWWAETEGQAPWTRRAKLSAVNGLFEWLVDAQVRTDNPARLIKAPRVPKTQPKVLTADQVAALRRTVETRRDHLMIELMLTLGLRVSEVAGLDADDLLRDEELLVVHGKGGKTAMIPMVPWMLDIWPPPGSGPVLRRSVRQVRDHTKRLMVRAGIHDHTAHSLRRTCGTELARKGVGLELVSQLLRHESVQTTARHYVATSMDDLRRAVQ